MKLIESILHGWPIDQWRNTAIVVAVSGGPDSVALLHALHKIVGSVGDAGTRLVVAHVNHSLRGAESDEDAAFVDRMARSLSLECVTCSLAPPGGAEDWSPSEDFLRNARHRFLRDVAERFEASWIATGHTANDVVETLLQRLLRGSGPAGLASIQPIRRLNPRTHLVHPLLGVDKAAVLEYLQDHGLAYRVDSSNESDRYTRNRIRHQLLPYLREFAGGDSLDERLRTAAQWIREEHEVIEAMANRWVSAQCVLRGNDGFEMPLAHALSEPWAVVRQGLVDLWHERGWPLRAMSAQHWDRMRRWFKKSSQTPHPQRLQLPDSLSASVRRQQLKVELLLRTELPEKTIRTPPS
ncbi:MAG: tRNA lysidine(34) synthetase TilS [Planctomycetota bacterium]